MLIKLFYFWFALLPFSWIIAHFSNFTALDKLLAPVLLLLGLIGLFRGNSERMKRVIFFLILLYLLLFFKHLSFTGLGAEYINLMWVDAVKFGYFAIPLLCIKNLNHFRRTSWLVVLIGIAGCISAFLVAMDLLTLPKERFEISRIGVESIQKSIGIFPSYGDLAQFMAYTVLWCIVLPGTHLTKSTKYKLLRWVVAISFVLGLIGLQSRNVLISVLFGLVLLWLLKYIHKKSPSKRTTAITLFSILGFFAAGLTLVFSSNLIQGLSSIGGGLAAQTADARLGQYAMGWDIISNSPLMGASSEFLKLSGFSFDHIHNMWIRLASHGGILTAMVLAALLIRIFILVRAMAYVDQKVPEVMVVTSYFGVMLLSTLFYPGMGELYWALLGTATALTCFAPYKPPGRKKQSYRHFDAQKKV
ncbi:O-antigen ligase [Oceanicoccus sp. KOV_DT_Chl]|uniref:O-antigen ligase family protein n=1 Tax=Oceanicoccus sp. KOV_DT_Chl TaxID=1904639 RepID=UPI000C7A53D1|nr:O-antigen ligase family protein [Oceanicoccus sp. KOV_DT_Chl]